MSLRVQSLLVKKHFAERHLGDTVFGRRRHLIDRQVSF
jgi:hypothetical protein